MLKLSRREINSLAAGALLSGCGRRAGEQAQNIRIAVANKSALIQLPLLLAQELGYFREEQLNVSLDDAGGSSKAAQALLAGSVEVASALFEQAVLLNHLGRNCLVFWLFFNAPDNTLFGSPAVKPAVRSLKDLMGRTVGVSTVGSPIQKQIEYAMRRQGLKPEAVTFVTTPNQSSRIAGLQHGRLDAAIMGEPGASLVRQQLPDAPVLADFTDSRQLIYLLGSNAYPGNALFSTKPWVAGNAGAIQRLARAISKAAHWAKSHTAAEIVQRLPDNMRSGYASVMERAVSNMLSQMSSTGMTSPEAADAVARLMGIGNEIQQSYTNQFAGAPHL